MRLSWSRSSRAEDRFERWIAQHHQERVLAGETTPAGPCPDEAFLLDLARKSKRVAPSDPRVDHAANCHRCMSRLLSLREENRSRQRKLVLAFAAASCLVIAAALVFSARHGHRRQSPAGNIAAVSETVNLWDAGTFRGVQPGPLRSVTLPASRMRLTIILPRFSAPGKYLVAVTRDRAGNTVLAAGVATATRNGNHETVSVDLDLRKAKTGLYFLGTTHEQDQASYYYPLQIR